MKSEKEFLEMIEKALYDGFYSKERIRGFVGERLKELNKKRKT